MENWLNVGKLVNTHGVRGEVRVLSRTDFPEERFKVGNTLYLFNKGSKEPIELKITSYRIHKNFHLLTFEGYTNINMVEPFKEGMLRVPKSEALELEADEYYYHDLIDCVVTTEEGQQLGKIKEILSPGANDVWVVKGQRGKEYYIPFIEDVVKNVDIQNKQVKIHVLEGLL